MPRIRIDTLDVSSAVLVDASVTLIVNAFGDPERYSAKRVTQELDNAPKNAGPINSHMLVLRSLASMRDISPDYLSRLTSYVDTLLSLDQCNKEKQASTKKATGSDGGPKMKSRRAKTL